MARSSTNAARRKARQEAARKKKEERKKKAREAQPSLFSLRRDNLQTHKENSRREQRANKRSGSRFSLPW